MLCSIVIIICIRFVCSENEVIDVDTKIVGGQAGNITKYPYQISLEIEGQHACGGSLIRPNIVLTAAHCMFFPANVYIVRAGSTMIMEGGTVSKVSKYLNHPKYTDQFDYDVSILKLKHPFRLSHNIQVINLQPVDEEIAVGTLATVTGWGDLKSGGPAPKGLHEVGVPKTTDSLCKMNEMLYKITNRMVCFGFLFGGKDACQMDSGGPLVVEGKQVGIVSWGMSCAVPLYPGVYTKISNKSIRKHIDHAISEFEN